MLPNSIACAIKIHNQNQKRKPKEKAGKRNGAATAAPLTDCALPRRFYDPAISEEVKLDLAKLNKLDYRFNVDRFSFMIFNLDLSEIFIPDN